MIGLCLALLAAAEAKPEPPKVYALVIANNRAYEAPELAPLRFADDDGARYFELLSLAGERVTLLSVLDPETQDVYPTAASVARAPTERELDEALERIFGQIEEDRRADRRTAFYFVYVGHGSLQPDGQGAMHLLDGRITRGDLFRKVVARSPATTNHVVIDACNAYFMVQKRGAGKDVDGAIADFLDKESLARYPNTGVFLSTTQAAEVHEWARFSAGIFSHELRSGMAGAADVDGDGEVGYDELGAFIAAANAAVKDPRARIAAYASPPAIDRRTPFFSRKLAGSAPALSIPSEMAGRYYLEDARGVRYADVHTDGAVTMTVVPSSVYFLRNDDSEIKVPLTGFLAADLSRFPRTRVAIASRGSEAITFQRDLFAVAFGASYFQGFTAGRPSETAATAIFTPPERGFAAREVAAISLGGTGLASLAMGVTFGVLAAQKAGDHRTAIGAGDDVAAIASTSEGYAATANVMYAVGGGLIAGALALWLWPSD